VICEICKCDPCDCEDMMGYNDEFRGLGTEGNEWDGQINSLADEGNRSFHKYGKQVEEGNQTKDRILPEGMSGDFQRKEDSSSDCDSPRR
jgi:hypothetical protein